MGARDLVFFHAPFTRSGTIRVLMEELGVPYRLQVLDLAKGEHKTAEFRALNPMGKVPTIQHGDAVVSEVAAICCYLADAFPQAGLAPALDDPRRGAYLKWLFFVPTCFEAALMDATLGHAPGPASRIGYGTFDAVMDTVAAGIDPGPYLLGEMYSAADIVLASALRWASMTGALPHRDAVGPYLERIGARPTVQAALAADAALASAG